MLPLLLFFDESLDDAESVESQSIFYYEKINVIIQKYQKFAINN